MEKSIYSVKHKRLCKFLAEARKDAGLTQQDLADKLNKHQSFVAKYEGGERRLDLIELMEIAQHISLDISNVISQLS